MASKANVDSPPGTAPDTAANTPAEASEPAAEQAGGTYINTGATDLILIAPPGGTVQSGRVIDLPYTPTHRGLRPATAAEIKASADAEAAEAAAATKAARSTADTDGREA